jgi:hypothetical protein
MLRRISEPDGVILLEEADPIFLTEQQELNRRVQGPDEDLAKYMNGSTWIHKANCLYTGFALKNNFIVGCVWFMMQTLKVGTDECW